MVMATKAMLDQLRAERPKLNSRVEYNIEGPLHTHVVSSQESERIAKINFIARRLNQAHIKLDTDISYSSRRGLSHTHFNMVSQERNLLTKFNETSQEIKP